MRNKEGKFDLHVSYFDFEHAPFLRVMVEPHIVKRTNGSSTKKGIIPSSCYCSFRHEIYSICHILFCHLTVDLKTHKFLSKNFLCKELIFSVANRYYEYRRSNISCPDISKRVTIDNVSAGQCTVTRLLVLVECVIIPPNGSSNRLDEFKYNDGPETRLTRMYSTIT